MLEKTTAMCTAWQCVVWCGAVLCEKIGKLLLSSREILQKFKI